MGFAELGETLGRNNRALRQSAIGRYFDSGYRKRVAGSEQYQLSVQRQHEAGVRRRRGAWITYGIFIALALVIILGLFAFY